MLAAAWVAGSLALLALGPGAATAAKVKRVVHYACSGPNSAHLPCHFSTPSGNIRCLWTPAPNTVACVLLSSGRAYRLRPQGSAKAIKLTLSRPGETLPTNQLLVFPQNLGCQDTKVTMMCGQAYGLGTFTLSAHGSHRR